MYFTEIIIIIIIIVVYLFIYIFIYKYEQINPPCGMAISKISPHLPQESKEIDVKPSHMRFLFAFSEWISCIQSEQNLCKNNFVMMYTTYL